ncbi:MAG: ABC transporter permease [Rhodobacteraceae bacterium]|nr:ABC transporter permease [Paracoccaceae bacterium]
MNKFRLNLLPILTVVTIIFALWYAFAVVLNKNWADDKAKRGGYELTFTELVADTWTQKKPRLPTPNQVGVEIWNSTGIAAAKKWNRSEGDPFLERIAAVFGDKRSLIRHAWLTLSATMLGFLFGTGLGIFLAIGIVYNKAMNNSVMPWVITSQTIPILALAPMLILLLNAGGITGIVPKAFIAAYLSFFPVVVGMVKGLRSPDAMQMDLIQTWSASKSQTFWRLRLPSSVPFLFPSLKVGVAASLVGAIVAELTLSQDGGLGARILQANYYGATMQIWSALIVAATLAACLVALTGLVGRKVNKRMGFVA